MTDDDKALKWLDEVIAQPVDFNGERTHARRIREMLKRAGYGPTPAFLARGCPTCGIGADGAPMAYACQRNDCPTRAS